MEIIPPNILVCNIPVIINSYHPPTHPSLSSGYLVMYMHTTAQNAHMVVCRGCGCAPCQPHDQPPIMARQVVGRSTRRCGLVCTAYALLVSVRPLLPLHNHLHQAPLLQRATADAPQLACLKSVSGHEQIHPMGHPTTTSTSTTSPNTLTSSPTSLSITARRHVLRRLPGEQQPPGPPRLAQMDHFF